MLPPTVHELEQKLFKTFKVERLDTLPSAMQAQLELNFQVLQPLETVSLQFESQGLVFRNAIALTPSNPRFITRSGQIVLMPRLDKTPITIELSSIVDRLSLWGRSTQPISLQAIDDAGQVMTTQTGVMCHLPEAAQHETSLLPRQVFKLGTKLDAVALSKVTVFAKAPLIIEGVSL